MLLQIALAAVAALACSPSRASAGWPSSSDYSGERSAGPGGDSPPPPPSYRGLQEAAESKSYADDDRPPRYDGPSHARTGPHKALSPLGLGGAGSFGSAPLGFPQRTLPHGAVIGYLAYPQPLLHGGYGGYGGYPALGGLHDSPALLPSAAFSHLAYAPPAPLAAYPHPLGQQPTYQHQPPYQHQQLARPATAASTGSAPSQHNY